MRNTGRIFFAVILAFVAVACCKEEMPEDIDMPQTGTLTITFKPEHAGAVLHLDSSYINRDSIGFRMEVLKFYLSDLRLVKDDMSEVQVADVLLLDMEDPGSLVIKLDVAPGHYQTIRFGLGVDSTLNAADPSVYPAGHPLSIFNNTYWTWSSKYRFILIEGKTDTLNNGNFDYSFVYHTGLDSLYREVDHLVLPFHITNGNTSNIDLHLDADRLFYGTNDTIDFVRDNITHTTNNFELARRVTDNFIGAMY
ncbi:MAG: hypothetical protein KDD36_00790 [Flavobacteriales bacterium]|nr:hypothetical protein [Flavobacteriales bacterium]